MEVSPSDIMRHRRVQRKRQEVESLSAELQKIQRENAIMSEQAEMRRKRERDSSDTIRGACNTIEDATKYVMTLSNNSAPSATGNMSVVMQ